MASGQRPAAQRTARCACMGKKSSYDFCSRQEPGLARRRAVPLIYRERSLCTRSLHGPLFRAPVEAGAWGSELERGCRGRWGGRGANGRGLQFPASPRVSTSRAQDWFPSTHPAPRIGATSTSSSGWAPIQSTTSCAGGSGSTSAGVLPPHASQGRQAPVPPAPLRWIGPGRRLDRHRRKARVALGFRLCNGRIRYVEALLSGAPHRVRQGPHPVPDPGRGFFTPRCTCPAPNAILEGHTAPA